MIGGRIGLPIGGVPTRGGFRQLIAASMAFSVSMGRGIGKAVSPALSWSVSVGKAVTAPVVGAALSLTASVFKDAAVPINAVLAWTGQVSRGVSKLIVAQLRLSAVFRGLQRITSRLVLHDPVDFVLAGTMPIRERVREWFAPDRRTTEKTVGKRSGVVRRGGPPSFTSKTDNRGYD